MEDIYYVKSGLAEIAHFATKCICRCLPVSTYGGIELRVEAHTSLRGEIKKWLVALKRKAENNCHVFGVEVYLNQGEGEYVYEPKFLEK